MNARPRPQSLGAVVNKKEKIRAEASDKGK